MGQNEELDGWGQGGTRSRRIGKKSCREMGKKIDIEVNVTRKEEEALEYDSRGLHAKL